jgi:hypothetical protein
MALWRCRLIADWSCDNRRLFLVRDEIPHGGKKVRVANGFTFIDHDEGDAWFAADGIPQGNEIAQAVLDAAWAEGMRPRGFGDIKNESAAVRAHLEDMRSIAFHKLGVPK